MGDTLAGMYDLRKASTRKLKDPHRVIDEAIEKRGEGFTVYSMVNIFASGVGQDKGGEG